MVRDASAVADGAREGKAAGDGKPSADALATAPLALASADADGARVAVGAAENAGGAVALSCAELLSEAAGDGVADAGALSEADPGALGLESADGAAAGEGAASCDGVCGGDGDAPSESVANGVAAAVAEREAPNDGDGAPVPLGGALPHADAVAVDAGDELALSLASALEHALDLSLTLELVLASADALCPPAVSDAQPLAEGGPDAVPDAALECAAVALEEPVGDAFTVNEATRVADGDPEAEDAADTDTLPDGVCAVTDASAVDDAARLVVGALEADAAADADTVADRVCAV